MGLRVRVKPHCHDFGATVWHIGGLWWSRDKEMDLFSHMCICFDLCVNLFPFMFPHLFPIIFPRLFPSVCPHLFSIVCPHLSPIMCPHLSPIMCPHLFLIMCPH